MIPFDKSLDAISGTDVERLVADKVKESLHLEYKSETYGNSTADHREFLKDGQIRDGANQGQSPIR